MRIKDGFILRTISKETFVVPMSGDLDLNMMIKLNDTGRFLWENMQKEITREELIHAVLRTYHTDSATAGSYIDEFIRELDANGFLC